MRSSISRNAFTMAWATILSRVLGFARDIILAFALGASPLADAFFVAFRVPNILRRLFAEGSLTMAFVPVFSRILERNGPQAAFSLTRSVQLWLLIILVAMTVLVLYWANPVAWALAPGFAADADLMAQTVTLLRICFPYIIFISSVALCMGTLNGLGHFLAPALSPCILNLALIAAALAALATGGNVALYLSWGVLAGGLGQWLLQQPWLQKAGFRWLGPASPLGPEVAKVGRMVLPTVFGSAIYQINIVATTILASMLAEGSISILYYADRIVQLPLGVFGVSLATAALPAISSLIAQNRGAEAEGAIRDTFAMLMFVSLPAMAGLMALAGPIVSLLFGRGAFGAEDTRLTALALQAYAIGLPAFCGVRTLVSAFYSFEDTKTPVLAGTVSVACNIVLGIGLMRIWGVMGLALATTLASWVNMTWLGWRLRRMARWDQGLMARLAPMMVISAAMGLSAWATTGSGKWSVALVPIWAILYFGACLAWKIPEGRAVAKLMVRGQK
ncbi:MAG: murein biosynthesis integral membrane protein MurJ [Deltaproteobacteria bacterium]|nr:murein biosynthesis integral membrane protein MurJ [Deltaproteobacteria bacterium]